MDRMTLYRMISARTGVPIYVTKVVVEEIEEEIKNALMNGENVYFRGFGTFNLRWTKERGCNLPAKEHCVCDAHYVPNFKPSKKFLKQVSNEKKI